LKKNIQVCKPRNNFRGTYRFDLSNRENFYPRKICTLRLSSARGQDGQEVRMRSSLYACAHSAARSECSKRSYWNTAFKASSHLKKFIGW